MPHNPQFLHKIILLTVLGIGTFHLTGLAQTNQAGNVNANTNAANAPIDRDIQDLEKQKRILELENEINRLKRKPPSEPELQMRFEEARDTITRRESFYRLMQYAFTGSGMISLLLTTYLFINLLFSSPDKPKESDTPEETLRAYHNQALSELRWYSAASLIAMFFGITIIFAGALLALVGFTPAAIVSGVAGIITEGVSLLFHRQTDKIRARVAEIERQLFNLKVATVMKDKAIQDKAMDKILDAGLSTQYLSAGGMGLTLQQGLGQKANTTSS